MTNFRYINPWKEMNKLVREMNDLFGDYTRNPLQYTQSFEEFPPVNLLGNEEEILVAAELPGIDIQSININALEDTLFLQGKRELLSKEGDTISYQRQERNWGVFRRAFKLPFKIDPDKVTAKYEKGILEIRLPRSEKEKPRKINVVVS